MWKKVPRNWKSSTERKDIPHGACILGGKKNSKQANKNIYSLSNGNTYLENSKISKEKEEVSQGAGAGMILLSDWGKPLVGEICTAPEELKEGVSQMPRECSCAEETACALVLGMMGLASE